MRRATACSAPDRYFSPRLTVVWERRRLSHVQCRAHGTWDTWDGRFVALVVQRQSIGCLAPPVDSGLLWDSCAKARSLCRLRDV